MAFLIATLLRTNNLHAPKIITSDLAQGFLLLEDLG
jgi:aminoglycoside/choline kinase family phosphotransferase